MKKDSLRFVVLGDTHFCTREIRGKYLEKKALFELPDHVRYAEMTESVLKPLLSKIKMLKPDFVISTGDFVEGGMPDHTKTRREMKEAWALMKTMGCPLLVAKGTHEEPAAYRQTVLPEMEGFLGEKLDRGYFVFERKGCAFLILDYLDYIPGNEQDVWLEKELIRLAGTSSRIFIAAHPPLYNWGRHFFNEPAFINRMIFLCKKYSADAYFCGHTHNQTLSFHQTEKGKGFLQVMSSSVGYPDMDTRGLAEFHALAEFTSKDHFLWGLHEDSSPGFYLVEVNGDSMSLEWQSLKTDKVSLYIKKRHARPERIKKTAYRKYETKIAPLDMFQIKSAVLYVYGSYANEGSELFFNGVSLGRLPLNSAYAARRFAILGHDALKTLSRENKITIMLPGKGDFVIGSISLELLLLDDRIIHSEVSPELFVRGGFWKDFPQPRKVFDCKNKKEVSVSINIGICLHP
ncbi:MAG: hypothetical protein A2020_14935 [Lentisphaerae bacterium GWF2_45_14]|nr:MAG: hypothetical protein A2020_14935 [Lentisphaerae bacterium GWF2_45_14]